MKRNFLETMPCSGNMVIDRGSAKETDDRQNCLFVMKGFFCQSDFNLWCLESLKWTSHIRCAELQGELFALIMALLKREKFCHLFL